MSGLLTEAIVLPPGTPLSGGLCEALRRLILDGRLPSDARLPASRELARDLGLSRNTVLRAYEQLQAEGYLRATVGDGTYVRQLPAPIASAAPIAPAAPDPDRPAASGRIHPARLSRRGQPWRSAAMAGAAQWGAFMPGVPDVSQFPGQAFGRILARLLRRPDPAWLTYASAGAHPELRQALATHLRISRGVRCGPEQILVTEGAHQALDLTVRLLSDPGDTVWVEEPGYWGFHAVLRANEARIRPVPVDAQGIDISVAAARAIATGKLPKLILVTPSHQYPLGTVMPLARRQQLLEFAAGTGSWIVEDDYDSEFRYGGQPIPAMQGLDGAGRVIYVGTFSKTLYPGARVAYMVLPPALVEPFGRAHADIHRAGNGILYRALAELLESGLFSAHVKRMRTLYGRRRALLADVIERRLGGTCLSPGSETAGLHLVLRLPEGADDQAIEARAGERGVLTRALSRYCHDRRTRDRGLLLGYACVPEPAIAPAFETLLGCIEPALIRPAGPALPD